MLGKARELPAINDMLDGKMTPQECKALLAAYEVFVPPADNETPDLTLCGEGHGWKLVLSDGCGRAVSEPLDQPEGVVGLLEIEQRPAQVLDGIEGVFSFSVRMNLSVQPFPSGALTKPPPTIRSSSTSYLLRRIAA